MGVKRAAVLATGGQPVQDCRCRRPKRFDA